MSSVPVEDVSPTQQAIAQLGASLARELDRAIAGQVTARLGNGWSRDELTGRLECFVQHGRPTRYCLDGKPLLDVHEVRIVHNGRTIDIKRDVALHDQALFADAAAKAAPAAG
jgi:hypothetical protein